MPQAKWLVNIDWNNDGDFSDADEDASADVLGLTLEHARDLVSGHVEAARLELQLRNDDHKYSPSNGSSPLSGNLKPGRSLWLRAAYPYDGFSDPAGTQLASHVPDYDSGFAWTEHLQGFDIAAGGSGAQTDGTQGNGDCVATMDFGDADVSFGCHFTRGSDATDHGGLCLRYSDTGNFLYVRVTGTAVELRKLDSSVDTQVATASHTWNAASRKFLQVVMHGDSIRVFVNNTEVLTATSSFNNAATRHGLFCDDQADHVWNDFGGWVSLFFGSVDSIHPRPRREAQYCYIRALDEMERLTGTTLYMYVAAPFPQDAKEILEDILDYAAVPAGRRHLDTGTQLVPDLWSPAVWHVQATDEVHRLQDEEDGLIYVDRHGFWVLEERDHRATAPHTAARATITDTNDGTNPYFSELVWDDGVANVENEIFMRLLPATSQGAQTAWTLAEKPAFAADETKEFLGETRDYDVLGGQLSPVENLDYEANTLQDGSGTDISSELTVTHPNTADFNGRGTLVRVTFGPTAGYLTLLKIRTLNAFTFDDPVMVLAEDATSKSAFGQRIRAVNARWTRETDVARATVDSRLARRKDPKTVLNVVVPNGSRANMALILQRTMSDRLTVSYSGMGINGDFFIEGHRLTVGEGWTRVDRELLLQAV